MKKNILIVLLIIISLVILALVGFYFFNQPKTIKAVDSRNCTYSIEGENITLKNGYGEGELVPGSASKTITQYFGNESSGDFNGDGLTDTAFILTQNTGGSGTFFYVAVALADISGCKGTNAVFLGDRIAPQNTEARNGSIIVNYADRKADEPMVSSPTVGVSKYLVVENTTLKDVTPQ